jgi:succinate dehydrogenase / fumarate reductase, flavoprotein subunit
MALYREDGKRSSIEYVRRVGYNLLGKSIEVTDEVDVSLVKPRPRRYETAGAASATGSTEAPKSRRPAATTA